MNAQNDVILVSSPELRVAGVKGVSVPKTPAATAELVCNVVPQATSPGTIVLAGLAAEAALQVPKVPKILMTIEVG